ncbi:uncharacterized protein BDZ99DRAFT_281110 [Mytilinidion resinicola]|uniref:Secreted protein n=1 Tax=Mytilinidion resinicola TaxID=574789 RepID=A0A6A6YV31_9PEZI|nr:uncharacterized protein BDZ99DRAFT_281110 [Mytilinidion resinicola]KAF2811817.1 hypothetical protein BDZ99DRAFT_281110 [Mytilinidion resinicola]
MRTLVLLLRLLASKGTSRAPGGVRKGYRNGTGTGTLFDVHKKQNHDNNCASRVYQYVLVHRAWPPSRFQVCKCQIVPTFLPGCHGFILVLLCLDLLEGKTRLPRIVVYPRCAKINDRGMLQPELLCPPIADEVLVGKPILATYLDFAPCQILGAQPVVGLAPVPAFHRNVLSACEGMSIQAFCPKLPLR